MDKNEFQEWLNSGGRSGGKSGDFGQLSEDTLYNVEILSIEAKANNSFLLKAKTVSGATGKGTFVSAFYSDGTPNPELSDKLRGFNFAMADKLLMAGGIDSTDISQVGKSLKDQLDTFREKAVGLVFGAKVKANGEYWNIDKFSVVPKLPEVSTESSAPAGSAPTEDATEFGF